MYIKRRLNSSFNKQRKKENMLLIHSTPISNLKKILKDGLLKSSQLSKRVNQGEGIYDRSPLVYFSTVDSIDSEHLHRLTKDLTEVLLCFDSQLLYNRVYYTSSRHNGRPDLDLKEMKVSKDQTYHNREYPQYYPDTQHILKKLFTSSLKGLGGMFFQIFQQVAIRNKCNLKYLKYIILDPTSIRKKDLQSLRALIIQLHLDVQIISIYSNNFIEL